jgi:hypothetical protein
MQLLFVVKSKKWWIFCGQFWAIFIEYFVDSIEQYPLNILWTLLSSIHRICWGQCWTIFIEYSVDSIEQHPSYVGRTAQYPFTLDSVALCPLHNVDSIVLRDVLSKHVGNENLMSSKAFPLSRSRNVMDTRWLSVTASRCWCLSDSRARVLSSWSGVGPSNPNKLCCHTQH